MFSVKLREKMKSIESNPPYSLIPKVDPFKLFLDLFGLRKSPEGLEIANKFLRRFALIISLNENIHHSYTQCG